MASMFVDIDTSADRLEFYGSLPEDVTFAKNFWQSIYMLPHLESGLVSTDISQRLRSAPIPGNSSVTKSCKSETSAENDYASEFFRKVREVQQADQQQRIDRLAARREQCQAQLAKQRLKREQMEQRLNTNQYRRVHSAVTKQPAEALQAMQEIDEFEQKILPDCRQRPDSA